MTDLSTTDQSPRQHYAIWTSPKQGSSGASLEASAAWGALQDTPITGPHRVTVPAVQLLFRKDELDQSQAVSGSIAACGAPSDETTSAKASLAQARDIMTQLAQTQCRAERDDRHREAMGWLAANRQKYVGLWIALQGSRLLAIGRTAKEVYSRIRDERPPALVVKIEAEDLPFGGW
jgi:hypothetical protein